MNRTKEHVKHEQYVKKQFVKYVIDQYTVMYLIYKIITFEHVKAKTIYAHASKIDLITYDRFLMISRPQRQKPFGIFGNNQLRKKKIEIFSSLVLIST